MLVSIVRLELRLPARSLKEKRKVVRSMIDRIKARFDVRVSEVDAQDTWTRAVLGFAVVSGEREVCETVTDRVLEFAADNPESELSSVERETVHFGDLAFYDTTEEMN